MPPLDPRLVRGLQYTWDTVPARMRPELMFQVALELGLVWIEVFSALAALVLILTAFGDVHNWFSSGLFTRGILTMVFLLHASFLLTNERRTGFWLRVAGVGVAASWWCGAAAALLFSGAWSLGLMIVLLCALCFIDLIRLGRDI